MTNKRAILIVGISERDTVALAKQTSAQCESNGERWAVILEREVIYEYVSSNHLDLLCLDAWNDPIKNECILQLLYRTEMVAEDSKIAGVIVGGSFPLDESVRNIYVDILKEQGFSVEFKFVECSWVSIMCEALDKGAPPLPKLVEMWNHYNQSFIRQYNPMEPQRTAVIVSKGYAYDNEPINTMIKGLLESGVAVISLEDLYSDDARSKPEHVSKIDTFWRKVANYYNVQLVYETDPVTCHHWRMIGVPCISLTNPFGLKYRV